MYSITDYIREFATCHRHIKLIQERLTPLRNKKRDAAVHIAEYFEKNQVKSKPLEINGEKMRLVYKTEYAPFTVSFLRTHLLELIDSEEQVEQIIQHLLSCRTSKNTVDLKLNTKSSASRRTLDGYETE